MIGLPRIEKPHSYPVFIARLTLKKTKAYTNIPCKLNEEDKNDEDDVDVIGDQYADHSFGESKICEGLKESLADLNDKPNKYFTCNDVKQAIYCDSKPSLSGEIKTRPLGVNCLHYKHISFPRLRHKTIPPLFQEN